MNTRNLTHSPGSGPAPATQAQIAALAHEIWRERGCPEGSDVDIWLEAERQLNLGEPVHRRDRADSIPADPSNTDLDNDPAINPRIDREIREAGESSERGTTAFGL